MKAVIMAGGEGTRLRPLTCTIPKPMVPIANKPVMEHIINLLKEFGIKEIAATLYYLPSIIKDYFGNGEEFGVNLRYFTEEKPLGTGGSVLNTMDFIDGTFLVISGDAMTDLDIKEAIEFHKKNKSMATLVLKRHPFPLEYGIVILDENNRIKRFLEKPSWGEVFSDTINTGIYILEPEIFKYYKPMENFDFSKDLFPRLLKDNIPMYGYIMNGYWCDIGDILSYRNTNIDFLDNRINLSSDINEIKKGIFIGKNTRISKDAKLIPPVIIGEDCIIKDGAAIDSYSVIGNGCVIDEGVTIKRSILWDKTIIGKGTALRGSLIGDKSYIKSHSSLFEDSVVGSGCTLGENSTIKTNVKIWPNKDIKENSIISSNLIWSMGIKKNIFGNRDVSGEFNIDITPEFSSLISSAFVSVCEKNPIIIIGCDAFSPSMAIKQSLISGALSSGAGVIEIGNISLPVIKYAVRFFNASGGIHVGSELKDNRIHIDFLNSKGANIDRNIERKIENLYARGDFLRYSAWNMEKLTRIDNFNSIYIQEILKSLTSTNNIKLINPLIIISSENEALLTSLSNILELMGCRVYRANTYNSSNEFKESIKAMSAMAGVILNDNGEKITLIDNNGEIIDEEKYNLLALLILFKQKRVKKVFIPQAFTRVIENMAMNYNVEVVRSKSSDSILMNSIFKEADVSFYQYILMFDGIWSAALILDFLVSSNMTLGDLLKEIPDFYTRSTELECGFENRGEIIRRLIEENIDKETEFLEGIKVSTPKGWSIVLPDNERPVFKIYSEGFSEEYAKELSIEITSKIKAMLGD